MSTRVARLALADGRTRYVEIDAGSAWVLDGAPWTGGKRTGERISDVDDEARSAAHRRLVPVEPSKIVCVGRNYRAHAAELGNEVPAEPLLFLKPPSSLLAPDGVIELPRPTLSTRVDHEVELALVVARRARRIGETDAASHIYGFTIAGDITARDLQQRDRQWTRAKGFDSFCPVGPVVVSNLDTSQLDVACSVSGQPRQRGNTRDMVFSPATLLSYVSQVMTLEPGDVILTGTPEGVGALAHGDELSMCVQGIGELRVGVARHGS